MADPRFFQKINQLTLAQVASLGEVALPDTADKERVFTDVADLDSAGRSWCARMRWDGKS